MLRNDSQINMNLSGVFVSGSHEDGSVVHRLEDIGLEVGPGEWLNLVGVNGSGKSTLARLLAGIHLVGVGGVIERGFAGDDVSPIVLQQPQAQLFGETPREEIQFALEWRGVEPESMQSRIQHILSATGLSAFADKAWDQLSGGQQQLAAIAASAACEAPLMVLDEVTSMLDEANRQVVLQIVKDLHKNGTTIIWVTQRLDELDPDARTAALAGGRLVFNGTARSFLFGDGDLISPCEQCGLRLPYMAAMAIELRRLGRLRDPLPVSPAEWERALASLGPAVVQSAEKHGEFIERG
ncbi:energy-coupling factor ABC transporter ATP-binding protein [Paenibacillus eucommiae]|uniref:Energy-coupling factor transporter ATP-binding protein EcfA2 n=1 Tax=Paenibacillus eucommiae TaxID=1355755 RepID=A0ABS4ISL1_9BACL|nr:ATP-binding cassette domain-containing protein [Paenibacillus eucommiae]MBP1990001.1 energy-coupling factor transporter ATP-binding protein EcfA2 [Paenibacillus eucommiae]